MEMSNQTGEKRFSIVIPMYNAGEYIVEALGSALAQDIAPTLYEVIAVDDRSVDDTAKIVGEYADKYPGTIRLVQNPGKGVSEARNFGVEQASGKYLLFLDADDLLEPNVLGEIYAHMEEGRLDMLAMTYNMLKVNGERFKTKGILMIESNNGDIVTGRDFIVRGRYRGVVWMFAYRLEFLLQSGVKMLPIRHEDENFVPRILARAGRVAYAPIEHYLYRMREDSFMNAYRPENLFDVLTAFAHMRDDIVTSFLHDKVLCAKIEERASVFTLSTVKRAVRDGFGNEMEVIGEARSKGLIPVRNPKGNLKRLLLNRFPRAYIAFYRLSAKKKPRVC